MMWKQQQIFTCRLTRYKDKQFRLQKSWYLLLASNRSIISKLAFLDPHQAQGDILRLVVRKLLTQESEQNRFCWPSNCTKCGEDSSVVQRVPQWSQAFISSLLAYWNAERQGSLHKWCTWRLYFTECFAVSIWNVGKRIEPQWTCLIICFQIHYNITYFTRSFLLICGWSLGRVLYIWCNVK